MNKFYSNKMYCSEIENVFINNSKDIPNIKSY